MHAKYRQRSLSEFYRIFFSPDRQNKTYLRLLNNLEDNETIHYI